jgi:phosphate/sulfate permease
VNTICGRIMIGLSLLSSSVNIICGRIMIGLSLSSSVNIICGRIMFGLLLSVSEHNMWSCYDWVVVVVFRLLTQYMVVL